MSQIEVSKAALLVIDFQEDFCSPNGSLAIADGRAIASTVNALLALPFAVKLATRDWHPRDHISFAANHPPPDNQPFVSHATIANPFNPTETVSSRLWPVHCVQGTPGAELVPELEAKRLDRIVDKGTDARVEMYSAFAAPFREPVVGRSGVAEALRLAGACRVYVVGLAADYCVKASAEDAVREGFEVVVVRDGTRAVDAAKIEECFAELEKAGARVVAGLEDVKKELVEKVAEQSGG